MFFYSKHSRKGFYVDVEHNEALLSKRDTHMVMERGNEIYRKTLSSSFYHHTMAKKKMFRRENSYLVLFLKFSIQKKAPKTMLNFGAKNHIGDAEL